MILENEDCEIQKDCDMMDIDQCEIGIEREVIKFNFVIRQNLRKIPKAIMNRRYKKLEELIEQEDYFSETEIKLRAPIQYQMYVGRYVRGSDDPEIQSFSELLISQVHSNTLDSTIEIYLQQNPDQEKYLKEHKEIPKDEMENNIDELVRLMHEKFLAGLDRNFIDYNQIDDNE